MEQTATKTAPPKSWSRILFALRIGAVICAAFAFQTAFLVLGMRSLLERDMVIANKYISDSGAGKQHYRISCELPYPESGGTIDTTVPQRFYDAAKTGDTVHSPYYGYLQLVSEKKVIARYYSDELIVPGVLFFACLLPLSAFLKLDRIRFAPICMAVLTFVECLMIGLYFLGLSVFR